MKKITTLGRRQWVPEIQQDEGEDVAMNTKGELCFLVGIPVMKDVSSGGN